MGEFPGHPRVAGLGELRLAHGRAPLLSTNGSFDSAAAPSGIFGLTAAGREVLQGRADYVALNGIDRWMGGVHLTDACYRWAGTTVVRTPSQSCTVGPRTSLNFP